jgi:V/A-type H+-transporting ATPase subunit C
MNNVTLHAAASSKARALMGRLLVDEDYGNLMQSKDLQDFLDYLVKHTAYSQVFPSPESILHRNQLEIGMRRHVFAHFEKFYHYYHDNYRRFFKVLFMRYEVENLKLIIRAITRKDEIHHFGDRIITSHHFSYVDYDTVLKARNMSEFVESLSGTVYHQVLKPYINETSTKMQFYMEMNLDRIYFRKLKEVVETFKGKDRTLMEELLGRNSDLLNIQWIYRAKKFYGLSSEEILNYTLQTGLRYDYNKLKALCYLEDVELIREQVLQTEYALLFKDNDILMERDMERYIYDLLDELLKKGANSVIVPLAYVHKLEYEVRDLSSILECIKYHMTDIGDYLVRHMERG